MDLILQLLGCVPDEPFGPLDGGQMELLRPLDDGQKSFLCLWIGGSLAPERPTLVLLQVYGLELRA